MSIEKSNMLAGEWYDPADPVLTQERALARALCRKFNQEPTDDAKQALSRLFRQNLNGSVITPPFFCDYGYNIELGENVYFNVNCVLLDVGRITIGPNTLVGPGVHIYTVNHPMDASQRRSGKEIAQPVHIGRDVWIGGATVVCPGVHIGDETVVGAGSVVTKDLPTRVFAAGNPCRVIRHLS
jgi:maltose O-acetyltransferase